MSAWAAKKRTVYFLIVLAALFTIVGVPVFFATRHAPTCTDGIENQGEAGVDCGGPCALQCAFQVPPPIIRWARSFKVTSGVYNAVAMVENTALDVGTDRIAYTFKLYDSRNVLIAERAGETFLPPKRLAPIFEGGIRTGERTPSRTFFEFSAVPAWKRVPPKEDGALVVANTTLRDEASKPRLEATLSNTAVRTVSGIEVVAVMYDKNDNAIAASKTLVDSLPKDATARLVFTWSEPFSVPVARTEIISRVKTE